MRTTQAKLAAALGKVEVSGCTYEVRAGGTGEDSEEIHQPEDVCSMECLAVMGSRDASTAARDGWCCASDVAEEAVAGVGAVAGSV